MTTNCDNYDFDSIIRKRNETAQSLKQNLETAKSKNSNEAEIKKIEDDIKKCEEDMIKAKILKEYINQTNEIVEKYDENKEKIWNLNRKIPQSENPTDTFNDIRECFYNALQQCQFEENDKPREKPEPNYKQRVREILKEEKETGKSNLKKLNEKRVTFDVAKSSLEDSNIKNPNFDIKHTNDLPQRNEQQHSLGKSKSISIKIVEKNPL